VLGQSGGTTHAFLGQSYNLTKNDDFQEGSGLEDRLSDIVGRLELHPIGPLNLDFRFQLDHREFVLNRTGVTAGLDLGRFKADLRYARADATIIDDAMIERREEVSGGFTFDLSDRWSLAARHRHDLTEGGRALTSSLGILYDHRCILLGFTIERDKTEPDGVDPGTSALIRLQFKTLGGISGRWA
jgi:LPS-assembly protein